MLPWDRLASANVIVTSNECTCCSTEEEYLLYGNMCVLGVGVVSWLNRSEIVWFVVESGFYEGPAVDCRKRNLTHQAFNPSPKGEIAPGDVYKRLCLQVKPHNVQIQWAGSLTNAFESVGKAFPDYSHISAIAKTSSRLTFVEFWWTQTLPAMDRKCHVLYSDVLRLLQSHWGTKEPSKQTNDYSTLESINSSKKSRKVVTIRGGYPENNQNERFLRNLSSFRSFENTTTNSPQMIFRVRTLRVSSVFISQPPGSWPIIILLNKFLEKSHRLWAIHGSHLTVLESWTVQCTQLMPSLSHPRPKLYIPRMVSGGL